MQFLEKNGFVLWLNWRRLTRLLALLNQRRGRYQEGLLLCSAGLPPYMLVVLPLQGVLMLLEAVLPYVEVLVPFMKRGLTGAVAMLLSLDATVPFMDAMLPFMAPVLTFTANRCRIWSTSAGLSAAQRVTKRVTTLVTTRVKNEHVIKHVTHKRVRKHVSKHVTTQSPPALTRPFSYQVTSAIGLRARYAMFGTDRGHATTRRLECHYKSRTVRGSRGIALRRIYPMSGTDRTRATTRYCSSLPFWTREPGQECTIRYAMGLRSRYAMPGTGIAPTSTAQY